MSKTNAEKIKEKIEELKSKGLIAENEEIHTIRRWKQLGRTVPYHTEPICKVELYYNNEKFKGMIATKLFSYSQTKEKNENNNKTQK